VAGLVPATPIIQAPCPTVRGRRDKPGDDAVVWSKVIETWMPATSAGIQVCNYDGCGFDTAAIRDCTPLRPCRNGVSDLDLCCKYCNDP
jgi:hypothetical protein